MYKRLFTGSISVLIKHWEWDLLSGPQCAKVAGRRRRKERMILLVTAAGEKGKRVRPKEEEEESGKKWRIALFPDHSLLTLAVDNRL